MDILSLPTNTTFIMAESSAFFEAYRHVLEGLQEMMVNACRHLFIFVIV
jgi:hypothetical protein